MAVTAKTKKPKSNLPPWLEKMVKRQDSLNEMYEVARGQFAQAFNKFLNYIDNINYSYGTEFSFQQAVEEYKGDIADVPDEDDDDDWEEDEEPDDV